MRRGFTTGSCAAAAAKAAAFSLLGGRTLERVEIITPSGVAFDAEILDPRKTASEASCGVRKDGGDDPDVTTGLVVYSAVRFAPGEERRVSIDGGEGVGRVTRPGLDQPVGNAAINSGPRAAIEKEVKEVAAAFDYPGNLDVLVSIPGGREIAEKTFNPRLGIVGGLSVLGTSGVVEPMSTQAILDTIKVELNQNYALGRRKIAIAPGNYGLDFMKARFDYDLDRAVKCSNFIGQTLDMAAEIGFTDVLFCGHIGKLIKVAGGIMNTHSREADCRMEIMASNAIACGADAQTARKILDCVTTDEAYEYVAQASIQREFIARVMDKIDFYLTKRAAGRFKIESIVFSNKTDLYGATKNAEKLVEEIVEETNHE